MQLAYYLEDNKGNNHRVDKDIYDEFTAKRIPLSSLNAGYGVFYKGTGKRSGILLHRYASNAKRGEVVDHVNRNVRDSRRKNLRKGTASDNSRNKESRSEVGYKGVVKHHGGGYATYSKDLVTGRNRNLGIYRTAEVAARVWDAYQLTNYAHVPFLNFKDSSKEYVPAHGERCNGKRGESRYKGVCYRDGKPIAQATYRGKVHWLKQHETEEDAARAYDAFLRAKGVSEWKLNFPKK